jgi:hypothetical protein
VFKVLNRTKTCDNHSSQGTIYSRRADNTQTHLNYSQNLMLRHFAI